MTEAAPETLRSHRIGLWTGTLDSVPATALADAAQRIEAQGWASLWVPEAYGREALTQAQALLAATSRLVVATGIASIYGRGPMAAGAGARLVNASAPGRFVLGLGVSHQRLVERDRGETYRAPLAAMTDYLEALRAAPYMAADPELPPIVLAALGPRMLALSASQTAGAHSYNVPPEHTAIARAALGSEPLLVVEQAVVATDDVEERRRRAHEHLNVYTGLPNYRMSWERLGFDPETDFVRGGSERLADALVVGGDDAIRARVDEHLAAGADHVCVQVLGPSFLEPAWADWEHVAALLL